MAELINPVIGPDGQIRVRIDSGDAWTEIDNDEGRARAQIRIPHTKRIRPESNGSYGATIIGWTDGVLGFECDDDHATRSVFWRNQGRRILFQCDPEGTEDGKARISGLGVLFLTPSVTARGRIFAVQIRQHGAWPETVQN